MINYFRQNKRAELLLSLCIGVAFGFLLHRGGVTRYDVIINQLLLEDFTVVKIMLSAVIVGMVGVYGMKSLGLAQLHPKPGAIGTTLVGGVLFGVGFGILGLCPGTIAGAVGQGDLSALLGGVTGIIVGAMIFAGLYPSLDHRFLKIGSFGDLTIPGLLRCNPWLVVVPVEVMLVGLLWWIEKSGL